MERKELEYQSDEGTEYNLVLHSPQGEAGRPTEVAGMPPLPSPFVGDGPTRAARPETTDLPPLAPVSSYGAPMTAGLIGGGEYLDGGGRGKKILLGLLIVLAGGIGVIHVTGASDDPFENLSAFFDKALAMLNFEGEKKPKPTKTAKKEPKPAAPAVPQFTASMVENPYWSLPNELGEHPTPLNNVWTAAQEDGWRAGLTNQYVYQRYKTVKEIRAERLRGSEVLLYQALDQPKFWTRMEAVFALAEFGYKVDVDTVEKAVGDARPSLVKNYFKRFLVKRTPGELYVLRQAIRVVDGAARLMILRGLSREGSPTSQLYIAAAKFDPSEQIKSWLVNDPESPAVSSQLLALYKDIVVKDWAQYGKGTAETAEPKAREEVIIENVATPVENSQAVVQEAMVEAVELYQSDEEILNEAKGDDGFAEIEALDEDK